MHSACSAGAYNSTHSHACFGRLHTCMRKHAREPSAQTFRHAHTLVCAKARISTHANVCAYAHRRALREHIHMCTHTYKFAHACTKTCALTRMSARAALYTTQHIHAHANTYTSATHSFLRLHKLSDQWRSQSGALRDGGNWYAALIIFKTIAPRTYVQVFALIRMSGCTHAFGARKHAGGCTHVHFSVGTYIHSSLHTKNQKNQKSQSQAIPEAAR